jgi:hypothetical protein
LLERIEKTVQRRTLLLLSRLVVLYAPAPDGRGRVEKRKGRTAESDGMVKARLSRFIIKIFIAFFHALLFAGFYSLQDMKGGGQRASVFQ